MKDNQRRAMFAKMNYRVTQPQAIADRIHKVHPGKPTSSIQSMYKKEVVAARKMGMKVEPIITDYT